MAALNIKRELEKRRGGRTWKDLAKEIGCTPPLLSMVLNGKRTPPRRILEFLGIEEKTVYVKAECAE